MAEANWCRTQLKSGNADVQYNHFVPITEIDETYADYHVTSMDIDSSDLILSHATNLKSVKSILTASEIIGGDLFLQYGKLSFWQATIPEDHVPDIKSQRSGWSSPGPLMKPKESRYGNYVFNFSLTKLIEYYKNYAGCTDVKFLKLGTITFTREVSYVVLICPNDSDDSDEDDDSCPEIECLPKDEIDDTIPICLYQDDEADSSIKWRWNLTSGFHYNNGTIIKWDNICFAFVLYDGCGMGIPQEELRASLVGTPVSTWDSQPKVVNPNHDKFSEARAQRELRKFTDSNTSVPKKGKAAEKVTN